MDGYYHHGHLSWRFLFFAFSKGPDIALFLGRRQVVWRVMILRGREAKHKDSHGQVLVLGA